MKKLTKGSALIFSLIILTFLLAIAISVAQNAVTEKKSASTTGKSLQAFQVADSGSELFLKAIKEANSDDSLLEVLGSGCGDDYYEGNIVGGNYKIAFYNSEGDQINCSAPLSEVDRIKSVGTFGSTTRAVDVAVAAGGYWTSDDGGANVYDISHNGSVGIGGNKGKDFNVTSCSNCVGNGDLFVTGGTDNQWGVYDTGANGNQAAHTIFHWEGDLDHLGIAGSATNAYTLTVRGGGTVGASSYHTTSDIRYKKDIENIDNSLEKINNLQGVYFNWNSDSGYNNNSRNIGFIAQDVEKIIPEVVLTDNSGYKSIEYGNLSALLLEGIKQQQQEIDDLKSRIEELESIIKNKQ